MLRTADEHARAQALQRGRLGRAQVLRVLLLHQRMVRRILLQLPAHPHEQDTNLSQDLSHQNHNRPHDAHAMLPPAGASALAAFVLHGAIVLVIQLAIIRAKGSHKGVLHGRAIVLLGMVER